MGGVGYVDQQEIIRTQGMVVPVPMLFCFFVLDLTASDFKPRLKIVEFLEVGSRKLHLMNDIILVNIEESLFSTINQLSFMR